MTRRNTDDPGYAAWAKTRRELILGLPYWRAHHERHYCPEITTDCGQTWHYLDVEDFASWLLEIASPRQAQVFTYWMKGVKEKDIAEAIGLRSNQPVLMYVHDLFRKGYKELGKAA